jgi:hypothetical protein
VPEVREEIEANGGHRGDQTRSWFDRTCPVSSTQQSGARVLGFATGASGHTRSDASGRDGSSLDHDRMLALSRPVVAGSASSRLSGMSGRLRLTVGAQ